MRWWMVLVAGMVLGVATTTADEAAGGLSQTGTTRAISMVLNAGATWAVFAIVVGWFFGRPVRGALGATLALGVATAAYYLGSVTFGDRTDVGLGAVASSSGRWIVLAFLLGPFLGLIGVLTRSTTSLGALACWVPLIGLVLELSGRNQLDHRTFAIDPWIAWTQVAMICCAGLLGLVLMGHRRSGASSVR